MLVFAFSYGVLSVISSFAISLDCLPVVKWRSVSCVSSYSAVGLSALCDCGISWSYSLTFCCGLQLTEAQSSLLSNKDYLEFL